jgi:hypothetical protein
MYMSLVMSTTLLTGRTLIGICRVDFKHVFVNMIEVDVMQVAIVQIIDVAGMTDSHMAAGEPVLMVVPLMLGAGAHCDSPRRDAAQRSVLPQRHPYSCRQRKSLHLEPHLRPCTALAHTAMERSRSSSMIASTVFV